ncbi:MAG: FecR protein [Pedosphaera sp.]|nr:FecR protein [Pedosphaera sp.]
MKQIHRFAHSIFASAAVALGMIAFTAPASAQAPLTTAPANAKVSARVVGFTGEARYTTDNKSWTRIQKGDVLKSGTVIQTAGKSSVDIILGDAREQMSNVSSRNNNSLVIPDEQAANVVRIFENTVLGIDKLTVEQTGADEVSETQLDLKAGEIMGNVKKMSAASKYEIKIPNGVAGIRGTTYHIAASGVVDVLAGQVVIAVVGKDGTVVTRQVTAGFRYDPASDKITAIPGPIFDNLKSQYLSVGPTPATVYTKDHTIVYVSPVTHGHGHGHGNGHGNGNGNGNPPE